MLSVRRMLRLGLGRPGRRRSHRLPARPAGQGPSEPSSISATAVARNGKPWSSVPEEILSPPAVLKDVRLALGTIALDPRSSETAQKSKCKPPPGLVPRRTD